ncbi:ABC transporter transmembrane domain-containing protein [uncultured Roseovarius sp.]|uniref:ABC transporter transmembrane domain-containing protein n=1 Tax=uncultured Roseovarius sp. TaxID=293344 RepID=UPI00262A57A9|nr:ABC transporter transmembrane domain-containing protein [uncultured Roseovarius sp.]
MKQETSAQGFPINPPRIGCTTLAATLSLNLLALALPLVVLQVFDRVIPFEAVETLFFLFLGLCVVVVLEFILKWSRAILLGSQAEQFEINLYEQFVDATLNADPEEFRQTTPAAHLDRLGAISQLRAHYGGQARILSVDLPFTTIFIALIGLIGGWLVVVPLTSIVLLLVFKTALNKAQSTVFDKRKTLDSRRYSFLVEVLSQIRTLKANTMEPQMQRRYELLQKQTADISHNVILFSGFSQTFGALFSQMAVAGMGLLGGYLVVSQHIGIAELAACMLLNGRTVQPMLKALNIWAQSESLAMAKAKITEAYALPQRPSAPEITRELKGNITFENLALKHPERDEYLFQRISGEIGPGKCLALNGNSGSGKSSFMKLFLAELTPSEGELLIDGYLPKQISDVRGRGGIVYCDQSPVIFAGTVLENISAFGDGDAIENALKLSEMMGLEKILHRLPMGYNTPVHESQALMSNQNFLQGVTLVRALALRPTILLLNNISAAIDDATNAALSATLCDLKSQTTIVMAGADGPLTQIADAQILLDSEKSRMTREWAEDLAEDQRTLAAANDGPGAERAG